MKNVVVWQPPVDRREGMGFMWELEWDQPILDASLVPGLSWAL